jgi:hypothetical protein
VKTALIRSSASKPRSDRKPLIPHSFDSNGRQLTIWGAEFELANPADFPEVAAGNVEGKAQRIQSLLLGEAFLLLLKPKAQTLEALRW